MTSIIESALARRKAAQDEVERLDRFIQMYRELETLTPQDPPRTRAAQARVRLTTSRTSPDVLRHASDSPAGALKETENLVTAILRENSNPIPTRTLFEMLRDRGYEVGGKDGVATLSARLSRSSILENHKPFGWRLKEPRQNEIEASTDASIRSPEPSVEADEAARKEGGI